MSHHNDLSMNQMLLGEWKKIRQLTYDYLDQLTADQLALRLPFETSKTLGYQFWCMTGAHESYLKKLEHGAWMGFSCSLNGLKEMTPLVIKQHMMASDAAMEQIISAMDLQTPLNDGKPAYETVMQIIKHEMHHHGQLINFLFCHHLPIPESWGREWALRYDD